MSATAEKAAKPKVTIIEAIAKANHDAFADDPKVITLGEDLADPEGGGIAKITKGLSTSFGDDRVRSTPISEQAIMGAAIGASRSEEHTSELQSLMRISYAVFC